MERIRATMEAERLIPKQITTAECLAKANFEFVEIAWFRQKLMCGGDGAKNCLFARFTRKDDPHHIAMPLFDNLEQLHAVHRRHPHVADDGVEGFAIQRFESGCAAGNEFCLPFVAHRPEGAPQAV